MFTKTFQPASGASLNLNNELTGLRGTLTGGTVTSAVLQSADGFTTMGTGPSVSWVFRQNEALHLQWTAPPTLTIPGFSWREPMPAWALPIMQTRLPGTVDVPIGQ